MKPYYTYLKLGGSLITDKKIPLTPSLAIIRQLAKEIASAKKKNPEMKLILGHGSGSFGHSVANEFGTAEGVQTMEEWAGYAEVWYQARRLNQIVMTALHEAGLSTVSIDISNSWISNEKKINRIDLSIIENLLDQGIIPMVYGNVLMDKSLGGTIFSTEMIFAELCKKFTPNSVLISGVEDGIWADYPINSQLIKKITPTTFDMQESVLQGAANTDVTGGMRSKVKTLLPLLKDIDEGRVLIYNGRIENNTKKALLGEEINGTWLLNN